jgi:cation diffusion facilitator family transporter
MAINAGLAAVKMAAGVFGHSQALVADGVESLADILSSVIVWRGLVVAAAPADAEHPYGHGKAEPLAAAFVAAVLLMAAIGIAIKSISEIMSPHQSPEPYTLAVLIGVVLVKEGLFRFVLREAHQMESSVVRSDAWHHRSDAITSLAAAIGITVAIIGGRAYAAADDVAAVGAAAIIAWNGWRLLQPAASELMDTSPGAAVTRDIERIAAAIPGVQAVEKCIVRKMGYQYYVDMHVEVDPQMTVEQAHEISHRVKDTVRAKSPKVRDVLVHIEPYKASRPSPPVQSTIAGSN